ncbi:MAG: hypothetical protein HYS27_13510 [Deltaproteobacteria bacterium]|nr:hypothetical protein [Deltaproteobacteria bacterium]
MSALVAAASCTSTTRNGSTGACYATADDAVDDVALERDVAHRGVRPVPEGEQIVSSDIKDHCLAGLAVGGELVDENGMHFWLAVDAILGGDQLIPAGILSVLDGGEVTVRQGRGWNFNDTVTVSQGEQPILALQNAAMLDGDQGALQVDDAGADALPAVNSCGNVTSHGLRFLDDNGAHVAGNGGSVQLIVGGVEFLAFNIHSVANEWRNCTDGPLQFEATWVAFDNSL